MYYSGLAESGKRNRWTVKVLASEVVKCCEERIGYHDTRANFWSDELRKSEEALRSGGIKLSHFPVTGGHRTEAQLDTSMANRVGECQKRLRSNQDSSRRFVAFRAMLKLLKDEPIELNADDVLYFNLNGADSVGESSDEE